FRTARDLYPEAWQHLANLAPEDAWDDLYAFYRDAILSNDKARALNAAKHWYAFSDILSNAININPELTEPDEPDEFVLTGARISMHYWDNALFMPMDALLKNAHTLKDIPGAIVHGEGDFNCTIDDARDLHAAWPKAEFTAVKNAGHSSLEGETAKILLETMENLKSLSID
ncbi:MAG: hypothetical protein HON65_03820, partial [Rhodospirillales bacterium]|nr:hypothetical protein [Rhodospirillales bacterium]